MAARGLAAVAAGGGEVGTDESLQCTRGWLAALRGDAGTAETVLAALPDLRASENPFDQAAISLVEAFTAASRRRPDVALRHARAALAHAATVGISAEPLRWAWPLAARTTHEMFDTAATGELLAMLDSHPPGSLAPMLRAERGLVGARLAAHNSDLGDAAASFASAINSLREHSTPYHLAHGLLDHAQHLTHLGETETAEAAIGEARGIADGLRCQPLLNRADNATTAQTHTGPRCTD